MKSQHIFTWTLFKLDKYLSRFLPGATKFRHILFFILKTSKQMYDVHVRANVNFIPFVNCVSLLSRGCLIVRLWIQFTNLLFNVNFHMLFVFWKIVLKICVKLFLSIITLLTLMLRLCSFFHLLRLEKMEIYYLIIEKNSLSIWHSLITWIHISF